MNWQESRESGEFYSNYEEPSRTSLALGGLTMAFFAAILGANLSSTPDLGSIIVRAAVGLSLAIAAAVCLVCALRRESEASNAGLLVQPVKARAQEQGRLAARDRRPA